MKLLSNLYHHGISIPQMHSLELDSTVVVLLSVMALFDSHQVEGLTARDTILSHSRKFSLLLQRYMVLGNLQFII